ncbi:MAG: hypothetical protein JJ974_01440 [Phycisphaerales bacterium]|nr:hypothetical protein [Phycisphaerales bacterium]
MNTIHATISRATRRLVLIDSIRTITICLAAVFALMVFARLVQKVAPVFEVPWGIVFIAGPASAIIVGLLWSLIRKPSAHKAAMILDERSGLRETISTALLVESQTDGWSKAVVTDASDKARSVNINTALPLQAPKFWFTPIVAGIALLAVWWLPVMDLTGLYEKQEQQRQEQLQVQQVEATVQESQQALKEIIEQTKLEFDEDDNIFEDLLTPESAEFITPEESLRSAIKNLTSVTDKLEEKRNNEEGATFDAIRDAMKSLNSTEESPASEMTRAMARGDFKEAKEKLQELAEQMQGGDMSESEKKALGKQLENLQKQMEQMAQNSEQLQEQLKAAGLSEQQAKQLATDPNALKKALEEAGLTPEQAESLAKAAQAQQRASDAASAMSQSMGQMAQGMQSGDQQQAAAGSEAMNAQLSDLENMQQEAQSLESAMNQAQQQLDQLSQCSNPGGDSGGGSQSDWPSTGQYAQGETSQQGMGSGGPGQGLGSSPEEQGADFTINKEHASVRTTSEGPVIASTMVNGSQIIGESTAVFSDAVASATTQASEAIETKRIPREYESAVQSYFGRLDKAAKAADKTAESKDKPASKSESEDD